MFTKPVHSTNKRLHVTIVASDDPLTSRFVGALNNDGSYHVETHCGSLANLASGLRSEMATSLLIAELTGDPRDLAALEDIAQTWPDRPPVIVVADGLGEDAARRLLKLQIADWLSIDCSAEEVVGACRKLFEPRQTGQQAKCVAFVPAVGGAGATTLCLSYLDSLLAKKKADASRTCVVDLNFRGGTLADFLDLEPLLDVSEFADMPERLDWRLLEVMLAEHRSGFRFLAAQPSLDAGRLVDANVVGQLLDILSQQFDNLIIDLPPLPGPAFESVVRGADKLFLVTNMTVAGLRHARRMTDALQADYEIDPDGSVIVNKAPWRSSAGVGKAQVVKLLGPSLAGYVPDAGIFVTQAQNRGVLLSEMRRSDPIRSALSKILDRTNQFA